MRDERSFDIKHKKTIDRRVLKENMNNDYDDEVPPAVLTDIFMCFIFHKMSNFFLLTIFLGLHGIGLKQTKPSENIPNWSRECS